MVVKRPLSSLLIFETPSTINHLKEQKATKQKKYGETNYFANSLRPRQTQ